MKKFGDFPKGGTASCQVSAYWNSQTVNSSWDAISTAVDKAGIQLRGAGTLGLDLLEPLDEFHCLGREATREMAEMADVHSDDVLLDVGCGIGGPSRWLATARGCHVIGIDITNGFLDAARKITDLLELPQAKLDFRFGGGTDIPFPDCSFTKVWIQVASANIADRATLYSEARRVLRPGGHLAIFDIFSDIRTPIVYPVPWADDPSTSSLLMVEETKLALARAGFKITGYRDVTERALVWYEDQHELTTRPEGPPPLGFNTFLPDWGIRVANQARNIREKRTSLGYLVARLTA